jgi:hypothetical protein
MSGLPFTSSICFNPAEVPNHRFIIASKKSGDISLSDTTVLSKSLACGTTLEKSDHSLPFLYPPNAISTLYVDKKRLSYLVRP